MTEFVAQNAGNGISEVKISKIFRGGMPEPPLNWRGSLSGHPSNNLPDPPLIQRIDDSQVFLSVIDLERGGFHKKLPRGM